MNQVKKRILKTSQGNYSDLNIKHQKSILKKHDPYLMKKTSKKGNFNTKFFSVLKEEQSKFK